MVTETVNLVMFLAPDLYPVLYAALRGLRR